MLDMLTVIYKVTLSVMHCPSGYFTPLRFCPTYSRLVGIVDVVLRAKLLSDKV